MNPSNSSESQASFNANHQPEQTETITYTDCDYYKAADGNIEVFIPKKEGNFEITPNKKTVLCIHITTLTSGSKSTIQESEPEQPEAVTKMDIESYNAAVEGKIDFFINNQSTLDLRTPNKNTILHIYITALDARSESRTNFVKRILKKFPPLLRQANAKGETPLHIAARYGHDDIVTVLIDSCKTPPQEDLENGTEPIKEMLRMTNKEKDTALHEAVRYNHLEVVKLLIKEDPGFSYSANDAGETPLYIAAERGFRVVLFEILVKCTSPIMYGGPLDRTALHAAITRGDQDMAKGILTVIDGISRKADINGWTPLHLTAYVGSSSWVARLLLDSALVGNKSCGARLLLGDAQIDLATRLLKHDQEVAYLKDKKGRTPLHIAAYRGNASMVKSIVKMCPDCCELVDNRGWNVLHFAMKGVSNLKLLERDRSKEIIDIILNNSSLRNLLNEKNTDGDTPLHFYSLKSANNFVFHSQVDKMAFNKNNLTAYEIALTDPKFPIEKMLGISRYKPLRVINFEDDATKVEEEDDRSWRGKVFENQLVVAALITTVTFAACITMPGGFVDGESARSGSALLRRNVAFKAFVITDTISMLLSGTAVFIHLLMPALFTKYYDEKARMEFGYLAFKFILGAMVAMGLAFVTGTYAVLEPSLDLAIANCITGLTFFAFLFLAFGKYLGFLFWPMMRLSKMFLDDKEALNLIAKSR